MWQLAVLVSLAVAVIAAVAFWSLRGAREPDYEPPAFPSVGLLRQGDDVAKSRGRLGITERVGWLRRTDVDEEMWPAEAFGGVSDEQFWDDLSSDKPLATKARTAQPDGESRRRVPITPRSAPASSSPAPASPAPASPAPSGPGPQGSPARQAPVAHATPAPVAQSPATQSSATQPQATQPLAAQLKAQSAAVSQASTAAFPVIGAASATTAAFPAVRPALASSRTDSYAQPVLPRPTAPSGPLQAASTGSYPVQPASPRPQRYEEDPLTSDAYSLRSADDGRSYRSSRHGPYPATGDFPAATGYPSSYASGGYETQRGYATGSHSTGGYGTGSYGTGGYGTGGHSTAGYGSGPYPTAPAAGRHSSGGHRRDAYESTDAYPADDNYRGYRGGSGTGAHPYGPSVATGAPTPPYGERYTQPTARDYGSHDYGPGDSGGRERGYPAADYGSRDQAARDARSRYQRPADPRGGDQRGGVRY